MSKKKKSIPRPFKTVGPVAHMSPCGMFFCLILPYPSPVDMKRLNPHAGGNSHYGKSAATKAQRQTSRLVSLPMMPASPWEHALLTKRFYKPEKGRTMDVYNMSARCKGAIDGVIDAGLLLDDSDKYITNGFLASGVDTEAARMELHFARLFPGDRVADPLIIRKESR